VARGIETTLIAASIVRFAISQKKTAPVFAIIRYFVLEEGGKTPLRSAKKAIEAKNDRRCRFFLAIDPVILVANC
jgi:hypothetical protein